MKVNTTKTRRRMILIKLTSSQGKLRLKKRTLKGIELLKSLGRDWKERKIKWTAKKWSQIFLLTGFLCLESSLENQVLTLQRRPKTDQVHLIKGKSRLMEVFLNSSLRKVLAKNDQSILTDHSLSNSESTLKGLYSLVLLHSSSSIILFTAAYDDAAYFLKSLHIEHIWEKLGKDSRALASMILLKYGGCFLELGGGGLGSIRADVFTLSYSNFWNGRGRGLGGMCSFGQFTWSCCSLGRDLLSLQRLMTASRCFSLGTFFLSPYH